MIGRLADAEDFRSGKPTKLIILRPDRNGENKMFKALRECSERYVRVTFDDSTGEMRLVLPEQVIEALRD